MIEKSVKRGCRCGVGRKRKGAGDPQASHKPCQDGLRKSKCPCVAGGIGCTDVCRFFNCGNISVKRGCRCGVGRKRKGAGDPQASHKSCQDGLRKSKCPCVAGGIGCTDVCRCFNCGNI
ncbi:hypothetical protein P5673_014263, partial [Acropora cervicornis]